MQDTSPILSVASHFYGFEGCTGDQKRRLLKVEANAIGALNIAITKRRARGKDPELLELWAEDRHKRTKRL